LELQEAAELNHHDGKARSGLGERHHDDGVVLVWDISAYEKLNYDSN
jgi:hypothetical protein